MVKMMRKNKTAKKNPNMMSLTVGKMIRDFDNQQTYTTGCTLYIVTANKKLKFRFN